MTSARLRRVAVITGTGGLGLESACKLARQGFDILLGGRNGHSGDAAIARIGTEAPNVVAQYVPLDLADLKSVSDFATHIYALTSRLDVLVNNAGVMSPPQRTLTRDGFELQFGVNFLGHFALTAYMLPLLRQAQTARVVNVTSIAHKYGDLDLSDLQNECSYKPGIAYCHSKLAQAMFTLELQSRSAIGKWGVTSLAAHPGFARTNLFSGKDRGKDIIGPLVGFVAGHTLGHSAQRGAESIVHAASCDQVEGGALYGPSGLFEMRGGPVLRQFAPNALDAEKSAKLWDISEQLCGVRFPA